jgi:hypothetical protein
VAPPTRNIHRDGVVALTGSSDIRARDLDECRDAFFYSNECNAELTARRGTTAPDPTLRIHR